VLGPTLFYFYARHDIEGLVEYCIKSVKFLGLSMALPVGLICGLSEPLLSLWLGPAFAKMGPLLSLMTVHLGLNLGYLPLHNISTATKNVRWPGIVQLFAGVCNVLLAVFLARTRLELYGIALAGALILTARNIIFTPFYSARIIGKGYTTFLKEVLPLVSITAVLALCCWIASDYLSLTSWPRLALFSSVMSFLYLAIVWIFLLNIADRKMILGIVQIRRS
jgi:membrane protein EpsK